MKKFTLLIAMLICAVGFSQDSAVPVKAAPTAVVKKATKKVAKLTTTHANRSTADVSFGKAPAPVQQMVYTTVNQVADATMAELSDGSTPAAGQITVATGTYNGVSYQGSSNAESPVLAYESGPYFSVAGPPHLSIVENVTLGMSTYGFGVQIANGNRIAEDIVLTDDYDVTSIDFYGYQTGEPTTPASINEINVRIWDGDPADPASSVIWGDDVTNVFTSAIWSDAYRVLEDDQASTARAIQRVTVDTPGLSLAAGTYWVDWSYAGTGGSGPWQPPVVITGQTSTGNAQQFLGSTGAWGPMNDGGTATQLGAPIQVYGDCTSCGGSGDPETVYARDSGAGNFVSFDRSTPGTFNVIGPDAGADFFEGVGAIDPNDLTTAYVMDLDGDLYSLDITTGTYTTLGVIPVNGAEVWLGLTWDSSGTVYGVGSDLTNPSNLYTMDLVGLTATLVGSMGNAGGGMIDIAITNSGDMYGYDIVDDSFYSIDPATGAATLIGPIGFDANFGQGLAYNAADDILYMNAFENGVAGQWREVDITTGTATYLADFEGGNQVPWASFAVTAGGGGDTCGGTIPDYENTSATGGGPPSQIFPDFPDFDCEAVDDFIISGAQTAAMCEIAIIGSGTGIPVDPANTVELTVYTDNAGVPGSVVFTESFLGTDVDPDGDGIFTLTPTSLTALNPGVRYWVSVVPVMEFGVSGQWFWNSADDTNDDAALWQNPGGGFATCTTWDTFANCGVGGGLGPDLLMDISFIEVTAPTPDECAGAIPVACDDVITGDTSDNTDQGGNNDSEDEWYSFTGTGSAQIVTVSLCDPGTTYDSRLTVYDSCGGTEIATNDDSCGLQSELQFFSDGTTTYYIAVEGFAAGDVGPFVMSITCEPVPDNDQCDGAFPIVCGDSLMGTTINSTDDTAAAPDCDTATTTPGVWYVYNDTSGLPTDILLSTCSTNTNYDTKISVYTGDCGSLPLTCVAGNDDSGNCTDFQSEVEFQSDGNTTYYILVHGFGGATGDFELSMSCTIVPPPNDPIANAIDLNDFDCPWTDENVAMPGATTEAGNPTNCDISGANGVWYTFTPIADGFIRGTVLQPAGATSVTFYTAPDETSTEDELVLVDWFENQCFPNVTARIPIVTGQAYYCFVVNTGGATDIEFTECDNTLGTSDVVIAGFSYYPNPAVDVVNLTAAQNIERVEVFNMLGQKVIDQSVNASRGQLNVAQLNQGTYLMKVYADGEIGAYHIIKQ
ncbi:T9SS type A sorting domain-containing protein [Aureisphaera galaxeae]|uniref:T9SS type A sorting domain-containing protein n=1 Tax=Aureisphaera galaxeae TaxID=1538023 RepID=UPI00235101C1|nr:T9SS type A sorting domain-containing protein [Aureisphaera galaxeae]MDC8004966.1 T9SS type A sorting domain-containing protein [Aureisphaera galaxeae]